MVTYRLFFLLSFLLNTRVVAQSIPPTAITDAERQYAVRLLQQTKADLLKTVAGLSPAQVAWQADSTRWSISQASVWNILPWPKWVSSSFSKVR